MKKTDPESFELFINAWVSGYVQLVSSFSRSICGDGSWLPVGESVQILQRG